MKTFVYTRTEGKTGRNGATPYTVRIFRIIKGEATLVASGTDHFVSEFQQVMELAEKHNLFPKKAFVRSSFGGFQHAYASHLREAKIVNINHVW